MNKQKWLVAGLSLAMAASLSIGIAACGVNKNPDGPNTPEHTHEYTKWQHDDTQHWKVCPADDAMDPAGKSAHTFKNGECECGAKEGEKHTHEFTEWKHDETQHWMVCPTDGAIWEQGKQAHNFTNGNCECGMENPDGGEPDDDTPDADLDTREFWVTGSGAGDLKNSSWEELKPNFKLTKQPKKDAEGFTLYTIQFQLYAGGDNFKIRQDERDTSGGLVWTDGAYFSLNEIKDNDGTFVDGGLGNIAVAKGKDGIYKFTVHTKPAPAPWADNYVSWELVKAVEPLPQTEDIYIVGNLKQYPTNAWPSLVKNSVQKDCVHLEFDDDKTWSVTVRLTVGDQFKLYNTVSSKYYPDPDPNLKATETGDFTISWVVGTNTVTLTPAEHTHYFNRFGHDDKQHWNICWLDTTEDTDSAREEHVYDDDADTTCNTCGYIRHIHKFDQWGKNETEHWKQCSADGAIDESTKEDHTFDPDTKKCECGQEQGAEACKHEGKINFAYTADNVPAAQEAGGTLTGTCAECGEPVEIAYDKIGTVEKPSSSFTSGKPNVMVENDHKYYLTHNNGTVGSQTGAYVGYKIEKAGTLTLRANLVYGTEHAIGNDLRVTFLAIAGTENGLKMDTGESGTDYLLVKRDNASLGKWNTASKGYAKWKEQMTFTPDLGTDASANFVSMSVTFKEEDVGSYMFLRVNVTQFNRNASPRGMMFLIETSFTDAAPASISAPAEVAMLPEKKD